MKNLVFIRQTGVAAALAGTFLLSIPTVGFAHDSGSADSSPVQSQFVGPTFEKSQHPLSHVSFTIIHDTHFHGNFGNPKEPNNIANYFGIANKIKAANPNSLFIGNGDDLGTSVISSSFQGQPIVDAFNAGKLDVDTYGNHDFDMGPDQLTKLVKASQFPWVSANAVDKRTGDVFAKEAGAKRFIIKEVGGVKIGITGLINEEAPQITSMGPDAIVLNPVEAMKTIIPEMKAAGAQFIIVSSHLASPDARIVAEKVDGIDLIVGDHAAFAFDSPEKIHNTLLWFIGDEFTYLGEINFNFDHGKVADFNYHRYALKTDVAKEGYQPDPNVKAVMDSYNAKLSKELEVQIGTSQTEMDVMKASQRKMETAIGDLVADAMKDYTKADMAIINGGGIRAERVFPAGPLTKKDIMDAMPFANYVEKLDITGDQLYQALENGVSLIESGAGRYPQVSGIQFSYNPKLLPGARLLDVKVNGQQLDRKAHYTIAVVDFVAEGGDGYDVFKGSKVLLDKDAGPLLSKVVADYIQQKGTVAPKVEGRIQISGNIPNNLYSDLSGQSFEAVYAITDMVYRNIAGAADGSKQFQPDQTVTVREFAKALSKAVSLTSSAASAAVDSAAGVLDPNAKLTRTQMAILMSNAIIAVDKYPQMSDNVKKSLDAFADKDTGTDDWAAVAYMGLIRGKSDEKGTTYLAVSDFVTRAQMAIVLERLLQLK
ncbi:bifunctional UDP-sugar hydrolase/5'-nucleotidase [Paenibacillus sp. N3.4]|uniref:bifunctional metallophosphatase/5'-nucleotidase n=1 Tax=Paenibacillus sp. N3.4 TaxID=2603222 RepID=UPI0011CBA47F|nr:bifunctional UDP-sugar hydrolase/5'-nucleotidase [Paenibacillus sp. N3.4]TXK76800.1 bifunctional metallophosphatase/5'-nucleotidase [Paenibacillus sp. N3.4]